MKRLSMIVITCLVCLAFISAAYAAPKAPKFFKAKHTLFDPDDSGIVAAFWITHAGLPDAGGSDHALILSKFGETSVNAAAIVTISGVSGITLTELGFDFGAGWCGAGAPRFNVTTTGGDIYFFGCSSGESEPVPDFPGWQRIRFADEDAVSQFGDQQTPWPGFGKAVIDSISIVFDEGTDITDNGGFTIIDNIDINGTLIGKPGNTR